LLVLAVGCLQVVLDKGQENDWFGSTWIVVTLAVAVYSFVLWILWEWRHPEPIVNLRLFRHRNFATAMLFTFVLGIVLFGTTVIIPQFLQLLLGYPAQLSGEALAGGGLIMLFMMPIAGFFVSRIDPRIMMAFGFWSTAASLYFIATHLSLQMDFRTAFLLRTFQAMGLAFIFLPSNTLAYLGIPRENNNQISAMNSFVRNIGGSIGIAVITTYITRQAQKHQNYMVARAVSGNRAFDQLTAALRHNMLHQNQAHPRAEAYGRVMGLIQGQATTLAYIDVIYIMALVVALLPPFILFMRRPKAAAAPAATH
jgi:DHA2 family multidrug resistance protein